MAIYSLCVKCKKKIPYRTTRCDDCQKEYNKILESRKDERLSNFYRCYSWQRVRKEVLKDHNHLCYACKLQHKITPADEVHHIKNLAKHWELRFEYDNLIPLCVECHDEVHREDLESIEGIDKYFTSPRGE